MVITAGHCRRGLLFAYLLALTAAVAPHGFANENSALTMRGFATIGVAHNFNDEFGFIRDLSQPRGISDTTSIRPDSMLGLQLNYQPADRFEVVLQALSRYTYTGNVKPRLRWAFLRYAPNPDIQIRLGRLNWDVFMFSDALQVGYSHVWIRPPIEYFGLQSLQHLDGADIEYLRPLGPGLAWAKLYFGRADEKIPAGGDNELDMEGSLAGGANINYRINDWWFRLGAATARFENELASLEPLIVALQGSGSPVADQLGFEDTRITQYSAGAVYERGALEAQLMLARGATQTLALADHKMGYALFSYRLGDWRPYAMLSAITSSRPRRDSGFPPGHPLDTAVQGILEGAQFKQHTIALGVRHDFHPHAALKFQIERLHAHSPAAALARDRDPDWNGRGTIVSVALDFVF